MATTGFSFRGSDRVLILAGVLVLLWAWNPDALKRIFPFLPPFPGTGHGGGAEEDAAPAPAAPEEPDPFVPSPWWSLPSPAAEPEPEKPAPITTPAPKPAPLCYSARDVCALRFGVHHVISGGTCGTVVCNNGIQYDRAATYPDGRLRPIGDVHAEGHWWGLVLPGGIF